MEKNRLLLELTEGYRSFSLVHHKRSATRFQSDSFRASFPLN